MAWQLQIACSEKAAEVEFNVPHWGEEEDVDLSWLPLHVALGQHTQRVHAVTACLLCQPPDPDQKMNGSSPTFCCSVVLSSDTDFVASLMLYLCNLFISLARHSSVPPTPPSPLNFHFLCKPLSVTGDHVCHPLTASHACPGRAGLIHSYGEETSSQKHHY